MGCWTLLQPEPDHRGYLVELLVNGDQAPPRTPADVGITAARTWWKRQQLSVSTNRWVAIATRQRRQEVVAEEGWRRRGGRHRLKASHVFMRHRIVPRSPNATTCAPRARHSSGFQRFSAPWLTLTALRPHGKRWPLPPWCHTPTRVALQTQVEHPGGLG